MTALHYDQTGKIKLGHIYNQANPTAYFSTLRQLGYRVPAEAKPVFRRLIDARRQRRGTVSAKLLDLGCSYGVNAALLKHDLTMEDLYRLYGEDAPDSHDALVERDRNLFAEPKDDSLSVIGVDSADRAIGYAVETGMLDDGVAADLEVGEATGADLSAIADADMIISTGCVGYVGRASLERLVEPNLDRNVWMANFVLRMFDYAPVEDMMAEQGYVTEKLDGVLFPQRRFASLEEKEHVVDNLAARGLSSAGAEDRGWYFAEVHVSRPRRDAEALPLEDILSDLDERVLPAA